MTHNVGMMNMSDEEKERLWQLHIQHNIKAPQLAIRSGRNKVVISHYITERRKKEGYPALSDLRKEDGVRARKKKAAKSNATEAVKNSW